MRKALIALALCCFLVVGSSFVAKSFAAQTDPPAVSEHAAHSKQEASTTQAPDDTSKNLQMMQEHIDKMRAQMEKIKATTDPQERQKLMEVYMTTMMDSMKMLKSLPGCKMMSEKKGMMGMMSKGEKMSEGKMAEGKMDNNKKTMSEGKGTMGGMMSGGHGMMGMEDMMKCHKMMEKKSAMMQSMVEGLIESSQIMLQMKK
ncbi:MAG: hypothetical protein HQK69_05980 [Desulfamplus sp.]|nr:hypothetical protein [Desulfamplus sp.]